jgi:hypothetical protein
MEPKGFFFAMFVTVHHWAISSASWIRSTPSYRTFYNHSNIILQSIPRSRKWYLPFRFSNLYVICISHLINNIIIIIICEELITYIHILCRPVGSQLFVGYSLRNSYRCHVCNCSLTNSISYIIVGILITIFLQNSTYVASVVHYSSPSTWKLKTIFARPPCCYLHLQIIHLNKCYIFF